MSSEQFYRLALTEPVEAIEASFAFSAPEQVRLITHVFLTVMHQSFGQRKPTWLMRRRAVGFMCSMMGDTCRPQFRILVDAVADPNALRKIGDACLALQLMVFMASAVCHRVNPSDADFHAIVADLVRTERPLGSA